MVRRGVTAAAPSRAPERPRPAKVETRMITVSKVDSAQSVEIVAVGPGPTNRLFVFTGIAEINFAAGDNDDLHTDHAFLDVSSFHGDKLFDPNSAATKLAAIAWPASMHATDDADQVTWAVDTVAPFVAANGRLTLDVAVAVQGSNGNLARFSYEVFAATQSVSLVEFTVQPLAVQLGQQAAAFTVGVQINQEAVGNGGFVFLSTDHPGASLPNSVRVRPGTVTAFANGTLDPQRFLLGDTVVTITGNTAVNEKTSSIKVHK
jgi:hypothetical protein